MKRLWIFLLLFASSALAHDDEDAFRERVRVYLMENPEVILQAIEQLSVRDEEERVAALIAGYPDLFEREAVLGMGQEDAPIRVVEFFDYKCEPCKAMHPGLKALVADNPNIRIEMRQLPILTPGSERASRFALAVQTVAGDAAYSQAHDLLWAHRGPYNTVTFLKMSEALGLNFQAIETTMEAAHISEEIGSNRDMAIALEILGTPAFVTPENVTFGRADIGSLAEIWLSQ